MSGYIRILDSSVVVFGAINIDLLATASRQAAHDDSTPGTLRTYAGGVGRNIAENLARLGVNTTLVSAVGDDEFGKQMVSHLHQAGMDAGLVSVQANAATASYTAVHDSDGELLHAISDMRLFDEFQLPPQRELQRVISGADVVVVDANLPATALATIAGHCHGKALIADSVSRAKCGRLTTVLEQLSLLKVNRAEAMALTNDEFSTEAALLKALQELGPSEVLLTSGEEGVVLCAGGEVHRGSELPVGEVVSTSGAGDAMLSAVIAAKLAGVTITEQLQWGMKAAAVTLGVHSACSDRLSRFALQQ